MPIFSPTPDLAMHYMTDDFCDPWRTPETVLMLHGNAESGLAWYAWAPKLARRFRVVRPDMRGFGHSTPMPRDFPWTLDRLIDDFCSLMDHLEIDRFHLVGAKLGGTIARAFAGRRPDRVLTLTVVGTPPPLREGALELVPESIRTFDTEGVEHWARQNMASRLGSYLPPEGVEWWAKYMGRTAVSTQIGFMGPIYTVAAVATGVGFLWFAWALFRTTETVAMKKAGRSLTCRTFDAPRWLSPLRGARWVLLTRHEAGSSRSRTQNCWSCQAIPIMSQPRMLTRLRMRRWSSSSAATGNGGSPAMRY